MDRVPPLHRGTARRPRFQGLGFPIPRTLFRLVNSCGLPRRWSLPCRRLLLLLPVLFLGMISYRPQRASADEWQPISPDELKMTSLPEAPGAPAVILYRQVDRKDLGRANTEYNYVRIKILTEEGRRYANVEIPFDRSQTNVSSLRARTVHPDGSIVNFDGNTYDQVIVKSKGTKFFARTFSMPDVQVGSIVEYHFNYDFNDNYVYDSRWILSDD